MGARPMNKRSLVGLDASLSATAQHALRFTSEPLTQSSQDVCLVVLHVIPVPYDTSLQWGKSVGVLPPFSPAPQQRLQAERILYRVRTALQQRGIAPARLAWLQRVGRPADDIMNAARELGVDIIVIGIRGKTLT